MSNKNEVVAQLLQSSVPQSITSKLISELDSEGNEVKEAVTPKEPLPSEQAADKGDDNQPSILDMMIAAQREAKVQSVGSKIDDTRPVGVASTAKVGFKKGFLSSSRKPDATVTKAGPAVKTATQNHNDGVIEIKKTAPKKAGDALVLEDVQKALAEDEHPMLKALKQNDWITPDLATKISSSDVLSRGLSDPRCMAAIQLLQKNPKEAMQKFQNDPVVSVFLKEFAGIMASHFESLGSQSASSQSKDTASSQTISQSRSPLVQELPEIGPLHSKILSEAESNRQRTKKDAAAVSDEEERVQKILQDEELRNMLMDPMLQQILMECGDPAKFQRHMRDPETARKIIRLQQAGLVGTAK